MKQAQGSLDEAKRAGHMNVYILLFTFITIIFVRLVQPSFFTVLILVQTPLSFMTSLFAIPFDYFLQDGNIVVPPKWTTNRLSEFHSPSSGTIANAIYSCWRIHYHWCHRHHDSHYILHQKIFPCQNSSCSMAQIKAIQALWTLGNEP